MKPTASHRSNAKAGSEAGFTLTELVAGLLVASMLIVGLAEITRRYALTTVRAKEIASDIRTTRALKTFMLEFERIDPGSLELAPDRITASIGSDQVTATLALPQGKVRTLNLSGRQVIRDFTLPASSRFELTASGAISLLGDAGEPPLAIIAPARTAPSDCQFDAVIRDCR